MNIEFIGKGVEWTESMKSFVEGKLQRFSRFLKEAEEDQVEVVVTLSTARAKQKDYAGDSRPTLYRVDLDIYLRTWGGGAIHGWEEDIDPFSALDNREVVLDAVRHLKRYVEHLLPRKQRRSRR
jgi:putative sigma-54 modulation protein